MSDRATDYLDHLNEQQKWAVTHTEGPMLILAGAGSGKTRTITYKITHLIDQQICRPEQILAVTFTNKAAEEMRDRVEDLLTNLPSVPLVSTFHSFCVRVLRRHADLVGYRRDFTICDTDDQKRILKAVYQELGLSDSDISIRKVRSVISWAKSQMWSPKHYSENAYGPESDEIFRVYNRYERYLRDSNAMDFDDLVLLTVQLLEDQGHVREKYSNWYRYLLIDEYQDTNRPQYELVRQLTCQHQNITAVGDEDQSIYGFRGADIRNILHFEADFPGALIVKLEENYRSTQTILDAATAVVANNDQRKGKTLWTKRPAGDYLELFAASNAKAEAAFISHKVAEHLHEGEKGVAILYRTNFQSRELEEALRERSIPYKVIGGVSFYHRKEIKDALAYLRVALNPDDNVSLLRIINVPSRGIGQVTLDRVHQKAAEEDITLWNALLRCLETNALSARSHLSLQRFAELIRRCREFLDLPMHLCLDKILESSTYLKALKEEDSEDAHNRILNLQELITVAREHVESGYSVLDFLDQATLRSEADEYDDTAAVHLMTLHNAKGLEFPVIFLAGCEEGLFPHSRALSDGDLEEERRLCYVGLTRAQKRVYLTYSLRRRFYGRETDEQNKPSRFLGEIPEQLIRTSSSWDAPYAQARARRSRFSGRSYNSVDSVRGYLSKLSRKPKKTANSQLVCGARIVHEQFGYGRVLQIQDVGDDLKVTVQFPGKGIMKLYQRYAKLKPV